MGNDSLKPMTFANVLGDEKVLSFGSLSGQSSVAGGDEHEALFYLLPYEVYRAPGNWMAD